MSLADVFGSIRKSVAPRVVSQSPSVADQMLMPTPSGVGGSMKNPFDTAKDPYTLGLKELMLQKAGYGANAKVAPKPTPTPTSINLPGTGGSSGGSGGGSAVSSLSLQAASQPYNRALQQLLTDYQNNTSQAKLQGVRQDADLAELFKRLGNYTIGLKRNQEANYTATGQHTHDAYAKLRQQIQDAYHSGGDNTNSELARLGLGEVVPNAMQGLARDGSYLDNQAEIDHVNAIVNNNANSNLFRSLMQQMAGSAAVEGTSQRGHAKQATADALTQLMQEYAKNKNDLVGKQQDAMLQARLSNARAAQAARSSSGGRSNSLAEWIFKQQYKAQHSPTKTGKGLDAAMQYLMQYAGGNAKKASDLQNEFNFLSRSPDPGAHFGYSDPVTQRHLYNVWAGKDDGKGNGSGTRAGYSKVDADAINRAIAMFFGKA